MKKLLSLIGLVVIGCASAPVINPDAWTTYESILREAEIAGATAVPEAQLHLTLAREQMQVAKELEADGDPRAKLVLARAQADAEVARAVAREAKARGEAADAALELKSVGGVR